MSEIYIFDRDENLLSPITQSTGLINTWFKDHLNRVADEPFVFTVQADTEESQFVEAGNQVAFRDKEGDYRLFVIKEIDDADGPEGPQTIATCFPAFMVELKKKFIIDRRFVEQVAQKALDATLEGTRWKGIVSVDLGTATTNFYHMLSVDAIWKILEVWGGDFKDIVRFKGNKIVSREIHIIQRLGTDNGHRFEIDHNVEEIARTVISNPVTALYGYGASLEITDEDGETTGGFTRYINFADVEWKVSNGDPVDKPKGQAWVGDPDALERYGLLHEGRRLHLENEFSDQDYEDPKELLQATWEQLHKIKGPEVNYRLAVRLLERLPGFEHEKVSLGDTSRAIDRKFSRPIEIQARIIALEYDIMDIEGTAIAEMGQFLSVHEYDDRLDRAIETIRDIQGDLKTDKKINEGSFPDIKPSVPANVQVDGAFQSIQLYWEFNAELFVKNYEVYGSQVKGFVPDVQHLLHRGPLNGFNHVVETDQIWYYRIRAVNHQGRTSDYTAEYSGSTVRIRSEDILFGPDLAAELRELSKVSDILAPGSVDIENMKQEALDKINESAREYSLEEVQKVADEINQELADKAGLDYVDGKLLLKVDAGTYTNKMSQIDTSISGLKVSYSSVKSEVEGVNSRLTTAQSRIDIHDTLIRGKAEKTDVTAVNNRVTSVSNRVATIELDMDGFRTNVTRIDSKLAGLEVGGRNLLPNSSFNQGFDKWGFGQWGTMRQILSPESDKPTSHILAFDYTNYANNSPMYSEFRPAILGDGTEEVTVSFDLFAETLSDVSRVILTLRTTNGLGKPYTGIIGSVSSGSIASQFSGGVWKRYSQTFKIGATSSSKLLMFGLYMSQGSAKYKIRELKLEFGSIHSGYSVAPEDVDGRLNKAETSINQTAYDLTFKASQASVNDLTGRMSKAESSISVQSKQIEAKVDSNGLISSINLQPGTIKIKAGLLDLVGDVYITNGKTYISTAAVGTLAVADGAITRAKLVTAIIGEAQIENGVITNAKIKDVSADKIRVGILTGITITAVTINGSQFRSYDGATTLDITGGHVRLRQSNGSYVHINPNGLYGYNSNGSIRFQADSLLVTSRALGTTTANVYIAAQSGKEARAVDMKDVPSDGEVTSYTYIPVRAQGFYGNYIEANAGENGFNLYLRPRNGGEVRVTGANTTDVYYPLRVGTLYASSFVTTTTSAWIGTDSYVHIVAKGSAEGTLNPIYRNLIAYDIYGRSFITTSTHAYMGTDDELRIQNKGLSGIWRNVRANLYFGNALDVNNGTNLYIRPASSGEVRITQTGTTGTYKPVRASDFLKSSSRTYKTNIEPLEDIALKVLSELTICRYEFKADISDGVHRPRIGIIAEDSPTVATPDGMAVNQDDILYYAAKGIQELMDLDYQRANDINDIKIENQFMRLEIYGLKRRITELENTVADLAA
ncbi:phage tail spike protein [Rossellomorea marisflavi]|uniref:phage tail spike protein n=1 Tax=Rossellomorea marisflavi TaxID=189381 RepID=UPI003459922D